MFTSTTLQLTGLDELKRRLYDLPNKVEAKVVRGALVEGARVIRDNARAKAPEWHGDVAEGHPEPGTLKKAIIIKYIPERSRGGQFVYIVGVRHGKKYQNLGKKGVNRDAFYWWFVENGHYTRAASQFVRGAGRSQRRLASAAAGTVRFVPGVRFMRGGFEGAKGEALNRVLTTLQVGVSEAARTL